MRPSARRVSTAHREYYVVTEMVIEANDIEDATDKAHAMLRAGGAMSWEVVSVEAEQR